MKIDVTSGPRRLALACLGAAMGAVIWIATAERLLLAQTPLPGLTDTAPHPPPVDGPYAYATFVPPTAGSSYVDPVFGSTVRRLTSDRGTDDIYARNMWWNADATRYFHRGKVVNTTTGQVTHTIPVGSQAADAGFDPIDPNAFYYYSGANIRRVILGANGTFQDAVWLTVPATIKSLGGSINWFDGNGRYFIVSYGAEPSVHVFDAQNLALGPFAGAVPTASGGGYSGITPSGRHVGTYGGTGIFSGAGTGRSYVIDAATRTVSGTGTPFWSLCGDHGVFISPSDGKDYWVGSSCNNAVDVWRVDVTNDITGLSETQQRALPTNKKLIAQQQAIFNNHYTAVARGPLRDWAFLDSEYGSNTITAAYQMEIVAMNVITGELRRLAHHRSKLASGDYYTQPRVSASWSGEAIAFASNFQQAVQSDIYAVAFGSDVKVPTAAVTTPLPGGTLTGVVTVAADVTDDVGVVGVQFRANGVNIGAEIVAPPYSISWDSSTVPDGAVAITAVARDAAGNTGTSPPVAAISANFAPVIAAVAGSGISRTTATVTWYTSQPADSLVTFGPTPAYGAATTLDPALVVAHAGLLTGLAPATRYHYRVRSANVRAQTTESGDFAFTTAGLASQSFETDAADWYAVDGSTIERRASLYANPGGYADGVASSAGSHHARLANIVNCGTTAGATCPGPYTVWQAPNASDYVLASGSAIVTSATATLTAGMVGHAVSGANVPAGTRIAEVLDAHTARLGQAATGDSAGQPLAIFPVFTSGFSTQVDVYLDTAWAAAHPDARVDWMSSLQDDHGAFLSDYVFNVATTGSGFVIGTSTNATRSGAFPANPCPSPGPDAPGPGTDALGNACRAPVSIATGGWYTFRHVFHIDAGTGALAVRLTVAPVGGAPVLDHTILGWQGNATATAIGPRDGRFATEEIADLAIDAAVLRGFDALQLSPAAPGQLFAGEPATFAVSGGWSGIPVALAPGLTTSDATLMQAPGDTGTVMIVPSAQQPADGSIAFDVTGQTEGTVTLVASIDGVESNVAAFVVRVRIVPTIAINNVPANAVFRGSFTPAFGYSGDGATSVTSSTPVVCSVSGTIVSFDGAGTCRLAAHSTVTDNFTAATGPEQSFTIAPMAPTVSITNMPASPWPTSSFVPTFAYLGDGATSVTSNTATRCTVSGGTVTFLTAGTCTLVARATATLNSLAATGSSQSVAVVKLTASVTITNVPLNAVVGGSFRPTYEKTGDGTASTTSVTTAVCTMSSGTVRYVGVGTCTIRASTSSTTVYASSTGALQSFTIVQAQPTITIRNLPTNARFGGSFAPAYTNTGNGAASTASLTPATCTVAAGRVNYVGVGTCTLQASAAGTANYLPATGAPQSFTIAKANPTITINNLPVGARIGGSFVPALTYTGDGVTSVVSTTTSVCRVTAGVVSFVTAGTCRLRASATATTNYNAVTGSQQSFTITP